MNEAQAIAWRSWLALEREAAWLYPVIAARHETLRDTATAAFTAHRDEREVIHAMLGRAQVEVPAPPISYDIGMLETVDDARQVARDVELRICAAILRLSGQVDGEPRRHAIAALRRSATSVVSWGGSPAPFPGLD